jgi:vesicle coat complex subunit
MSYIPIPVVTDALTENLRHCLKDRDAYVRKTAAICVAKLYSADPRRAEKGGFVEMLRDLMLDSNATVVANAVAALSEIGDRQDGVMFKLNLATANKLLAALGESSEYATASRYTRTSLKFPKKDGGRYTSWTHFYDTSQRGTQMLRQWQSASLSNSNMPIQR